MTPDAYEARLEREAEALRAWAAGVGRSPGDVSRAQYFAALGTTPRFVKDFWGAVKERASGGKAPAPPIDAIPAGHKVGGVSTLVGPDGKIKVQWVKTRSVEESREDALARLLETLPDRVPVRAERAPAPVEACDHDLLAVYPLGDPHVGMLAWGKESGANFDLKIAEDLHVAAVRDLVLRGPRAGGALIVNLGDFFHFDNASQKTTRGDHTLDVDGRTARVLEVGLRIFVAMIDAALEHHDVVAVDNVAGNHDGYTSIMLAIALRHHYQHEPRVSIPVDPAMRHYHRHGAVLIGTGHGDREKIEDLGSIMASERPTDWGDTRHRVWLRGHVHHSQVKELRGCTVETFRTLAARDSWHAGQGYVAGRDLRRIVYHRTYGEVSREIAGLEYLEAVCVR